MTPALFVIVTDAVFSGIVDAQIQGAESIGGNSYYITGNLTPPSPTLYLCRLNANGSFLVNQSRQPALTVVHTFFGWGIPA